MGKNRVLALVLIGVLIAAGWLLIQRARAPVGSAAGEGAVAGEAGAGGAAAADRSGALGGPAGVAPSDRSVDDGAVVLDDLVYQPRDVEIFHETLEWARAERLDTAALGTMMVAIGRRFVGNDYTPHTLDLPGEERLVINLREFDCVTYVESVLALARVLRSGSDGFEDFARELKRIRYRHGELDGWVSRLHYFSEWIEDNAELGVVRNVTSRLGGRPDDEPIDFMSTHADAYAPLIGHPERLRAIREIERKLSDRTRVYIPQEEIVDVVGGIENGDIIAATSSVEGLDVAHTGLALWVDGRLHLMHAPLVGRSLEISEKPLAERILDIDGQDGIMVARPL